MYTANFNKNNADLKVRSSDGVDFDLHLAVLSVNAGSFPLTASRGVNPNNATTTSSGSGSSNNASTSTSSSSTSANATSTSTGPEVIHLSERAEVLRICFEFVYPKRHPDLEDLKEFKIVADIATAVSKYGIFAGVNTCNTRLRKFLPTNAMDIFLYAIKYDYTKLTNEAIPYLARSPLIGLLKKLPSNYTIPWVEYHDAWSTPFKNAIKRIKAIPSCSIANQCHPSTVSSNPTPHTLRVSTNFLGICTACRCAALVWVSNLEEIGTIEEVKSAVDSVIMLGSFGVGVGLGASGHGLGVSNLCCGAASSSAVGFSSSGQSPFAQFFAAPTPATTTGPITTTAIAPRVTPLATTTTTTTTNTGPTSGTTPSSSTIDSPGLSKLPFTFPTANATASTSTTTAPQATSSGGSSFGAQATAPFAPTTTGFGTTPFWVKPAAQAPSPPSSSSAAPAPASAPAPAPTPVATTGITLFGQKVSTPSVSTSAFGTSSSFGAPASTPAPAAPSASTTGSVFGSFGTTSTSTSTSASTTAPAPTPTTLFGSPFGAKAPAASSTTPTTGFGASSSSISTTAPATAPSAATSAFSSNASFGAKAPASSSAPTTGFGASSSSAAAASAPTSGFGATSSFGAKPPAASSTPATGFGASSSFGAASAGAAPSAPTSGFGATSSFGAKPPAASSTPATGFGASSSFGAASAGAAPSATTSGFGSSSFAAPAPAPAAPSPPSTTGPSESSLVLKTTNTKPSTAQENLRLMTTTTPSSSQPVCGHLMQVAKLLKEDIDAVPSFDTFFKANGGGVGGDNGDDAVDVVSDVGGQTGLASATPGGRAHKSGVVRRVRPGNWL